MDMIDGISATSRRILGTSGQVIYSRATRLRAAIVVLPFFGAALISFVYASWIFPPAWFEDIILSSTLFCLIVVCYCRTWIYRFQAGAPLLALSFGGALFFPIAASLHVWEYHIIDSQIGVGLALAAWALSTFCMWRLFQPSRDEIWNTLMERLRTSWSRWVVILLFPLIWASYGFSAFAFIDTQFDWASSRTFLPTVVAKSDHLHGPSVHYYVKLSPWPGDDDRSTVAEGAEVPAEIYDQLRIGEHACVTQHPGFLGARWYGVNACLRTAPA
ncbi:MAG TPA: hypothetical protein VKQ54_00600 [Caulobacteraceae bacterium]|nr:hypothetical protein [Caulobacteraceae bacterium]